MKDGDALDTQKANAARHDMCGFMIRNAEYLPFENLIPHFCCFHQNDKQTILRGFKGSIHLDDAMTGKKFCELAELDYERLL